MQLLLEYKSMYCTVKIKYHTRYIRKFSKKILKMTSKIVYKGNLRTEATHVRSGSVIETDAPVDNHGKGERFSPTDLVAAALGTCIITTIGIAANVHNIGIGGMECDVEKIMVSDPMRRIGEIKINLSFTGGTEYTDKEKKILEHAALTCPVAKSLHPDCIQTISINWHG